MARGIRRRSMGQAIPRRRAWGQAGRQRGSGPEGFFGGPVYGPVRHRAAPSFWQEYNALDEDVRKLADRLFEILKKDPQHPSLHLKKTGRFWSA
jgi:hypothetical protein